MTEHTHHDGGDHLPTDRSASDGLQELVARIVEADGRPTECTIFPRETSEALRATTWVTAREGSFVALDAMR